MRESERDRMESDSSLSVAGTPVAVQVEGTMRVVRRIVGTLDGSDEVDPYTESCRCDAVMSQGTTS